MKKKRKSDCKVGGKKNILTILGRKDEATAPKKKGNG